MQLGQKVSDKVTGFQGTVIGHVEYLTGCKQCLVQPAVNKEGAWVESHWFDDDRLDIVDATPISLQVLDNGPDKPAPRK